MKFEGTKEDWFLFRDTIDDGDGNSIARVQGCYNEDVEKANAKLIAAAPDMLAALKFVAENIGKPSNWDDEILAKVNEAIEKALK
jgi:hypothetical protein